MRREERFPGLDAEEGASASTDHADAEVGRAERDGAEGPVQAGRYVATITIAAESTTLPTR